MRSTLQRNRLALAMSALLAGQAQAIDFSTLGPVNVPNAVPDWGAPSPSDSLFFWGDDGENKSVRSFTYTGATPFRLSSIGVAGSVQNTYEASGQDAAYDFSQFILLNELYLRATVSRAGLPTQSGADSFSSSTDEIPTPTAVNRDFAFAGTTQISNRIITQNTVFDLAFSVNPGAYLGTLPDAVFTTVDGATPTPVTVTFTGTPLATGTIGIAPNPLNYNAARAGTSGSQSLTATISNTGVADTLLTGSAAAATAPFAGAGASFALEGGQSRNVSYSFSPLASLGGAVTAQASQERIAVANNDADAELVLNGTTVGPAFGLSGAPVSGTVIDLGNVLIGKNGSEGPNAATVIVTNPFEDPGNSYADPLTGLRVMGKPISSETVPGTFSTGTFSTAAISDNGGSRNLAIEFNPGAAVSGGTHYEGTITFQTDVDAPVGGNGTDFAYTLTGDAYLATLNTSTPTVDLGPVRIGGNSASGFVTVENATGGNFDLDNVTFGDVANVSPASGAAFGRVGTANAGTLADGAEVTREYTLSATDALGAPTTAQSIAGTVSVVSDQADLPAQVQLAGQAVGPAFELSGDQVTGGVGGAIDFGSVLITRTGGFVDRQVTVTNRFQDPGDAFGDSLTGLTVTGAPLTGTDSGAYQFILAPPAGPIHDNDNTATLSIRFSPTGAAGGQSYNDAVATFETDVAAVLGGDGADYAYGLTGTAYLATLAASPDPLDFGYVRIGGDSVTRTLTVENVTGGGYALGHVAAGNPSGADPTPGAEFAGIGPSGTESLADGASFTRDYSLSASDSIPAQTTPRDLTATVNVSSDESQDLTHQLAGQAVGPVFQMQVGGADIAPDGSTGVSFGKVRSGVTVKASDLGLATPTVLNRFGQDLGAVTDLGLLSTPESANGIRFLDLAGSTVEGVGGQSSKVGDIQFSASGEARNVNDRVEIVTDQGADNGAVGATFGYLVMGQVVGPDANALDINSTFDFRGSNVQVDPTGIANGRIDLGSDWPEPPAAMAIRNMLGTCDADATVNDELCGITIGAIEWTLPAGPLGALDTLSPLAASNLFRITDLVYPVGDVLSAGSTDTLSFNVRFNEGGLNLLPGIYDRTLLIYTDVGVAFGDPDGQVYSLRYTAVVSPAPIPGTALLLGSALGLLAATRRRRR